MDTVYTYIDLLDSTGSTPPESIVSRTFYSDGHLKAVLFTFAPGQELSEHTASMPAIIQILKGRAQLTLGGDKKEAKEGAWIYMPARLPHSVVAEMELVMLLLMMPEVVG